MVLITGITGLTGRFLFDIISSEKASGNALTGNAPAGNAGEKIRYLLMPGDDASFLEGQEVLYADVRDWQQVAAHLDGVDMVIHLAYIHNAASITRACLEKGVKRVIYVNTTGMFSRFKAYAADYMRWEEAIIASGIIYTIIRPTMIYGNERDVNIHKLIKLMDRLPVFPVIGRGEGLMQPIYAGDVAQAVWSACQNEAICRRKAYNIAGQYPLSYMDLLQTMAAAMGKKVRFLHIPYMLALLAGRLADFIPNGLLDYEKVQRLLEDKNFDYSEASCDLGFAPLPFSEGVAREIQALRQAGLIGGIGSMNPEGAE